MSVLIHLWRNDAELQPQQVATVSVNNGAISLIDSTDPEVGAVLAELARLPDLPLRLEDLEDTPVGPRLAMLEQRVSPSDPRYAFAVGQVAASVCGFGVTFTEGGI
jgi:hypothetical protein